MYYQGYQTEFNTMLSGMKINRVPGVNDQWKGNGIIVVVFVVFVVVIVAAAAAAAILWYRRSSDITGRHDGAPQQWGSKHR